MLTKSPYFANLYANFTTATLNGDGQLWQYGTVEPYALRVKDRGESSGRQPDRFIFDQPQTQGEKMRGLFEVFIVDPKAGVIVFEKRLVADDEAKARLKAAVLAQLSGDVDDYDIIVRKLGDVRAKKQVQEVRVVEK